MSVRDTGMGISAKMLPTALATKRVGRVMRELAESVGLATVLISQVMSLGFRSLRLGLVSMLPHLLTLAVVAAVISITGVASGAEPRTNVPPEEEPETVEAAAAVGVFFWVFWVVAGTILLLRLLFTMA